MAGGAPALRERRACALLRHGHHDAAHGSGAVRVIRNRLVFDLGLDVRDDVLLVSYDAFAGEPESRCAGYRAFLDFPFSPQLCSHVTRRDTHGHEPLDIDPRALALARDLEGRLTRLRELQVGAS